MIETTVIENWSGVYTTPSGRIIAQSFVELLRELGKEGWWFSCVNPGMSSTQELVFQRVAL
jgi:hypothetical protein